MLKITKILFYCNIYVDNIFFYVKILLDFTKFLKIN